MTAARPSPALDDAGQILARDMATLGLGPTQVRQLNAGLMNHGNSPRWADALAELPQAGGVIDLSASAVRAGEPAATASTALAALGPWRKGPLHLHGVTIDAEWRSDLKWDRLTSAVPISGQRIIDIGCGNFYYGWRALGAGATHVTGIDPTTAFAFQYLAVRRLLTTPRCAFLPCRSEQLDPDGSYSLALSMGVLYHRRAPLDHLQEVRRWLQPGGTAVIETLVLDGAGSNQVLTPTGRYAGMRNVWFIPSVGTLARWLLRAGFPTVEVVDITATTPHEQRVTRWGGDHSLADVLHPDNPALTIEGEPAPLRAMMVASTR